MPTLKIFAYKGHVGCLIDINGKFINDPKQPGQLGCVIDVTETTINKDAKDILKRVGKEGGSFAPLMFTEHHNGGASIGVMGFGAVYLGTQSVIKIGRTCQTSVLDKCTLVEEEAPKEFKDFIDSM